MKVQEENELYDEINVVPMLDLAYVLLVIFIIMTTASVQGIKVNRGCGGKLGLLGGSPCIRTKIASERLSST